MTHPIILILSLMSGVQKHLRKQERACRYNAAVCLCPDSDPTSGWSGPAHLPAS